MMLTSNQIRIPMYSGNIYDSVCKGSVNLTEFIQMNSGIITTYDEVFVDIAKAVRDNNKEAKRKAKHRLPAFTPSVFIERGDKRNYDNVKYFNRIIQLDFDGFHSKVQATAFKYKIFETNAQIICCYLSPSMRGVKALLKIKKAKNIEHYRAIYKAVKKHFDCEYFDSATKNAVLPLFLSNDIDMLAQEFSEINSWVEEDWTVDKRENMIGEQPTTSFSCNNRTSPMDAFNLKRVIRLFKTALESINDEGHTQLRTACLILGSRCGAGYITEAEAKDLAFHYVNSNSYFSKGLKGYLDTARWAIEEGMTNPRYYKVY